MAAGGSFGNHFAMPEQAFDPASAPDATPAARKFVRVIERHVNGLVRFEFAVGWPDLSCELLLPQAAFDEFCKAQGVEFLEREAPDDDFPRGGRDA